MPAPVSRSQVRPRPVLRLPDLDDRRPTSAWLIGRVVRVTLAAFVGLVIVGALVVSVVRVRVMVDAAGVLEPSLVWPVRARVTGVVSAVLVHTGDTVRAGQPIVRLDSAESAESVDELRAQRDGARADAERAVATAPLEGERLAAQVAEVEARLIRTRAALRQRMVDFGVGGDPDTVVRAVGSRTHVGLDAAAADVLAGEAELRAARAQLSAAALSRFDIARRWADVARLEAGLRVAERRRTLTTVVADTFGVVLTEQLERLYRASVREGDLLLELGDVRNWRAALLVREQDVHRVSVGDTVRLEVPGLRSLLRSERLLGRVLSIAEQSAVTSAGEQPVGVPRGAGEGAGRYGVLVAVDQAQVEAIGLRQIRRGFAVQAKIVTRSVSLLRLLRDYATALGTK